MNGFIDDIEELTENNKDFRRVLYTGRKLQLVLMTLQPGEDIGEQSHADTEQFFCVEGGRGEVVIDGKATKIKSDMAVVVPAGARHNIRNTEDKPLNLYALCAPPAHLDGTVHATKADAVAAEPSSLA